MFGEQQQPAVETETNNAPCTIPVRNETRLIRRLVIRNYKSIAACDVQLGPLTFLVGSNGSGKSNFLDALRFVADSLRNSLDHALRDRGGINEVRRRSSGHPRDFGIRLDFELPDGAKGHYSFAVSVRGDGGFVVKHEECRVVPGHNKGGPPQYYRVVEGEVKETTLSIAPAAVRDRLFLVNASGSPAFRPLYDALSSMGFYNLNPELIRDLQPPDPGDLLSRDGRNLPSVLAAVTNRDTLIKERIEEYLAQVVPGVEGVDAKQIGPRETLEFRQQMAGAKHPWRFLATNMSDGTLRALGVLVALFQGGSNGEPGPLLVGIEEPETALHPAAAEVLVDSLRDASEHRQVLVTSHSPELLGSPEISSHEILAVVSEEGETKIGHLDSAGRTVLSEHLYTAGDLLRMNQLRPDPAALSLNPDQLTLFGTA
ncbi:MAG TPA: AAA family ATPase [Longimicrobium sp.]|nr:AAA family ATPase [Longimicrobium sp.]